MILDLKFYLSLFLRRLHYFLVIAVAVAAVGLTVAYTLPPVYEAEAQLLVESPQIPTDLASSTVKVAMPEILEIIRQRLLTRASVLDIAQDFGVYRDRPGMSADAKVADMRQRIRFGLPNRRRQQASFVTVSFASSDPNVSTAVTNELVTRVLQENVALRTASTGQTLQFFQQEVQRLDRELADQGGQILQFKLENKDALPDSLDFRRTRQASLQEQLLQTNRQIDSLRDRRETLVELYERTGRVELAGQDLSPEERRLNSLQNELASALVLYSEQNPRVRALRAQVAAQEEEVAQVRQASAPGDTAMSAYELQLADLDGQMDYLSDQRTRIEGELEDLADSIDDTPRNAVVLGTLERDYSNLRTQYNQATADLAAARTGDQIEAQSRGQRISVIEQATKPRKPTSPNRRKLAVASVGGGIFLGLAFIALLEFLNASVRRPVDIQTRLGITPFATVPYIRTGRQIWWRRTAIVGTLAVVAVGIPVTLFLLHTYYLPMDMLVERALDKTGLSGLLEQLGLGVRS